jgi:hypothetical protein
MAAGDAIITTRLHVLLCSVPSRSLRRDQDSDFVFPRHVVTEITTAGFVVSLLWFYVHSVASRSMVPRRHVYAHPINTLPL